MNSLNVTYDLTTKDKQTVLLLLSLVNLHSAAHIFIFQNGVPAYGNVIVISATHSNLKTETKL